MDNFSRMIQLADEFFETKNDSSQLSITEEVMKQLRSIHPATMGEKQNDDGPIAWTIVIPTTRNVKELFLSGSINEEELLKQTLTETTFTSIYLCSALTLPEFRGKGIVKELVCNSIRAIQKEHHIKDLYVWSFSIEGKFLAEAISRTVSLPLFEKKSSH